MELVLAAGACAVGGVAAVSDSRSRRIPNALTFSALLFALAVRALFGTAPLVDGLLGAALAISIALPLFAFRVFGGGDLKLLVASGALLGPLPFFTGLLAASVIGAVMALTVATRRKMLPMLAMNSLSLARYCVTFGREGSAPRPDAPDAVTIPYGVAIALGMAGTALTGLLTSVP